MEFQMEIAPLLGYQGPIDPSIARWHPLPTTAETSLKGFQVPEGASGEEYYTFLTEEGERIKMPQEPGTVNTVNVHATPQLWAHEYRHLQEPDYSERVNRIHDGYYAQDKSDWNDAVDMWRKYQRDFKGKKLSMKEAEASLIAAIESGPADQEDWHSAVTKEYQKQKSGEQAIVGKDQVTTGSALLDIVSPKDFEFAAGRERGQYWYKAKQRLEKDE